MGVYIDMEMPESCGDCRLCGGIADTDCGPCAWCDVDRKTRVADTRQDCPLVPVPEPHGDLIDRHALLEGEGRYSISLCKEGIDVEEILRAKTIIPASEEA